MVIRSDETAPAWVRGHRMMAGGGRCLAQSSSKRLAVMNWATSLGLSRRTALAKEMRCSSIFEPVALPGPAQKSGSLRSRNYGMWAMLLCSAGQWAAGDEKLVFLHTAVLVEAWRNSYRWVAGD